MRVLFLLTSLMSFSALANWTLDSASSNLHFISVKNDSIAETHTFDEIKGSVMGSNLSINIPLSSVNTLIPIRNERMQKMLFDVANNPQATFSAQLDAALTSLAIGETTTADVTGDLMISGATTPTTFTVRVSRLGENMLNVATVKPTVVNTAQFNLNGGVEALREVAMLKVISTAVPITFNVNFTHSK